MAEDPNNPGFWKNPKNHLIPSDQVPVHDQVRDELVYALIADAKETQAQLREFKLAAMGDAKAYLQLVLEEYGVKRGGEKGNFQLLSYDGQSRVQVAVAEVIVFDERLKAAQTLVEECLHDWSEGARKELRAIVGRAFDVDKEGNVSTGKVLSLLSLKFDDERWLEAQRAIRDSITVQNTKAYIRFYERSEVDGKWEPISLDIAGL